MDGGKAVVLTEVEGGILPAYTPMLVYRASSGAVTADIKAEFSRAVNPATAGWTVVGDNEAGQAYQLDAGNTAGLSTYGYDGID